MIRKSWLIKKPAKKLPALSTSEISYEEAILAAKEIALLNNYYWDDATVKAELRNDRLPILYWDVMPGYDQIDETSEVADWLAISAQADHTSILIDANTGKFAGLDTHGSKPAMPASKFIGQWSFKFPPI